MTSGITANTVQNLLLDAAVIYKNYDESDEAILSATKEGATFVVEQEIREITIDGARGPLKGARRIVSEHARITASLLEMNPENVQMAIAGSSMNDDSAYPDHKIITREDGLIDLSQYLTNIAIVGTQSGTNTPFVCIIKNALADGNFSLETADQDEAAPEIQFTAHFDPSSVEKSPWEIRVPNIT